MKLRALSLAILGAFPLVAQAKSALPQFNDAFEMPRSTWEAHLPIRQQDKWINGFLAPTLGYTDNLLYASDDKVESNQQMFQAHSRIQFGDVNRHFVHVDYKFEGSYSLEGEQNDYADNSVDLTAATGATYTQFGIESRYIDGHDAVGTRRTEALLVSSQFKDEWEMSNSGLFLRFHGPKNGFNLKVRGGYLNKRYQNNKPATTLQDYDGGNASVNIAIPLGTNKAKWVLNGEYQDYIYENFRSLDGDSARYGAGFQFEFAQALNATLFANYMERNFESDLRNDADEIGWHADILVGLPSNGSILLSTDREYEETWEQFASNLILRDTVGIAWSQQWLPNLITRFGVSAARLTFQDNIDDAREDELIEYNLGVGIPVSDTFTFNIDLAYEELESDAVNVDHERASGTVQLKATF